MPVNASKNRFMLDSLLVLRAKGSAALTANTAGAAQPLDYAPAYWDDQISTDLEFALRVETEAGTFASHSYTITLQVATDSAFTTPVTIATVVPTAVGNQTVIIDRQTVKNLAPTAKFYRINLAVTGSTPSIVYNAYLSTVTG